MKRGMGGRGSVSLMAMALGTGRVPKVLAFLAALVVAVASLVAMGAKAPDAKADEWQNWRPPEPNPMYMESRADGNIYGICYVHARSESQTSGTGHNAIKFDIYMPDGKWVQGYCGNGFFGDSDHGNHAQPGSDYYNFVAYKWHTDQVYGETDYWIHIYSEDSQYVNHWGNPTPNNPNDATIRGLFSRPRQWVFGEIWYPGCLDITVKKEAAEGVDPALVVPGTFEGATYTVRKNDHSGFDGNGTSVGAYIKVGSNGIGELYRWDDNTGPTDERIWIAAGTEYVVFEVTTPTNGQWGFDTDKHIVDGTAQQHTLLSKQVTSRETHENGIGTTLTAENNKKTYSTTATSVSLTDKVTYTGLAPNTKYVLQAKLHYRNGNADGGEVPGGSATKVFTPTSADGFVDVPLTITPSAIDTTKPLVCYEYLYHAGDGDQPTGDVVASHEQITDAGQTVSPEKSTPTVGTTLVAGSNEKTVPRGTQSVKLTDTVTYSGLTPGKQYRLECVMHGKGGSTDKGVIAGASTSKTFTPTAASGSVEVVLYLSMAKVDDSWDAVVAFEELYDGQTKIAEHKVITDTGQTVNVTDTPPTPEIGTTLKTEDGEKELKASDEDTVKLIDTVSYSNLVVGEEYKLEGVLHVRQDGEDKGAIEGSKGTKTFTPSSASGTVDVELTLDMSKATGDAVVAFEKLYKGTEEVATHEEIGDTNQTVTTKKEKKKISTSLTAADGKKTIPTAAKDPIVLHDKVSYSGLEPGVEYELHAELRAKDGSESGTVIADTEKTMKFTPKESDGEIVMELTIDPSKVSDWKIVAFEKLYLEGELVASHEDINDEEQTVTPEPPSIKTKLSSADGKKEISLTGTKTISLVDEVTYTGLVPGVEYEIKGELHEKKNGKDGGAVKGAANSIKFTPTASDGKINVTMSVQVGDATKALVAFERLYLANSDKVLATHEDINDADQSFNVKVGAAGAVASLVQTGSAVALGTILSIVAGTAFMSLARRMRKQA